MKKDTEKEKNQPIPEPTKAREPTTSSASITLQLLNKEKEKIKEAEKKEAAAEAAKQRCKTCFKEIAPKRLCSGHGGGGGGGGDSASSDKTSEGKASQIEDKSLTKPNKVVETDELIGEFTSMGDSEELDLESSFDPEIIAELIAKEILLVENDRESMTLTIQFKPELLTKEQLAKVQPEVNKYMNAVAKEFNDFKKEHNLSDECINITKDDKGNILSLSIKMPTLALYDAFIQRLANNLVPTPSPKAQEKNEVTKERNFAPNPLSKEPKPSKPSKQEEIERNKDIEPKKTENEEEEQVIFNPSPFNMKPWK
ncbi:TPA: hypothetical protein JBF32_09380 [Legionella pneumophila]|nr:hypothetical protein [Legionella pneumophila]HAU0298305.1 hypothetical protein [Legionella pneumophila]